MKTTERQSAIIRLCALTFMFILVILLVPRMVQAGAAQPIFPGSSSIRPGEETPIQMISQVVTMNVRQATEADDSLVKFDMKSYNPLVPIRFPAIAEVEADFLLQNPTSEDVQMDVWFPLAYALENVSSILTLDQDTPQMENLKVIVDGKPVEYTVREMPNPNGADKLPLPWASFPVTFASGKETFIQLEYELPPQPSGYEMALYHVFQTGAGWAGPIEHAEVNLNLPYPASVETLAGIPPGGLRLPPVYRSLEPAPIPEYVVLDGNQVRWVRNDFEPGSQDDVAIWVLRPDAWQTLATARAAVEANPQDGQAWLDLAEVYYSLVWDGSDLPSIFSLTYLPEGIEAYQKASELLPEHPAPHAGLGLLTLIPYMGGESLPPEKLSFVDKELKTARDLEASYHTLEKDRGKTHWRLAALESAYGSYQDGSTLRMDHLAIASAVWARKTAEAVQYNDATATAFQSSWECSASAKKLCNDIDQAFFKATRAAYGTETAVIPPTLPATQTPDLTLTSTPEPAATTPTPFALVDQPASNGHQLAILTTIGVLSLVIAGFIVMRKIRKSDQKKEGS